MLWMIVIGLLVGFATIILTPERDSVGGVVAVVVGTTGAIVPAVLGSALGLYHAESPAGIFSSVMGAIMLSSIYLALLMRDLEAASPTAKHTQRY